MSWIEPLKRVRPRRARCARGDALARAPREEQVHARDELADEDRLGEVVLDAELEAADLVLDRLLAREEDDRDRSPSPACSLSRRTSA